MLADLLTKLMGGQVYAKLKGLWGLQMLVQGTDLKKATLAMVVMMVAASLQGLAVNHREQEPAFFCSEEGVCLTSRTTTAMARASWIETILNHLDLGMSLLVIILLWEMIRFGLQRLRRSLWDKKVAVSQNARV